jgi:hypothetical protein
VAGLPGVGWVLLCTLASILAAVTNLGDWSLPALDSAVMLLSWLVWPSLVISNVLLA